MGDVGCPLVPDVGVLALVPDPWEWPWQPRHHVLIRLARYFRVVWVEPARSWRELGRRVASGVARDPDEVLPGGLTVHRPEPWLPKLYRSRRLAHVTLKARLRRARHRLIAQGCRTVLLYVWRPDLAEALDLVLFDRSFYHIDDEYSFSDVDGPVTWTERRLIETVDQVFIVSPSLMAKKGALNAHTMFVPNGVDFAAYATGSPEPSDIAAIPHPRIGYTGIIKPQLDWALLTGLPDLRPDWSFVFVGPVQEHRETREAVERLARHANVYLLGPKSARKLSAYPRFFDVCMMPYLRNGYTKYIYPLKLHEYLAGGRPVVGTRIPSLEEFGAVVTLVDEPVGWPRALAEALEPPANEPKRRAARQAVAREHDWDLLVARIARTMARRLGAGYLARLETALEAASLAAAALLPPTSRRAWASRER